MYESIQPSYIDKYLLELWSNISNILEPSINDYKIVEEYLLDIDNRPYLNILFRNPEKQIFPFSNTGRCLKDIKLSNYKPLNIIHVNGGCSKKCIVFYTTCNDIHIYSSKQKRIANIGEPDCIPYSDSINTNIDTLKQLGYKGDILLRVGGYPMEKYGGIRFCHIPYSFKLLALLEASKLGYELAL